MIKRISFVFIATVVTFLGYSNTCAAQSYGVSLYFKVQGTGSTITSYNWNALYSSPWIFQDVYLSRNTSANTMDVMFFVSDLVPSSSGQRKMKFEVIYQSGPSEIFDLYIPESDIGGQVQMEGASCSFTMNYSPMLNLKPPVKNCNTVSLETSSVCGNFVFQASQDVSNPSSWRTVKTVPGADYYGIVETLTAADLQNAGIADPYGITWVRFKDDQAVSYPWANSYRDKRVSNMVQIDLDAPPPSIVAGTPVDAVCYGEATGSVDLTISNSVVTNFLISADNSATPQSPDFQIPAVSGVKPMSGLSAGTWTFTVENDDGDALGHCNAPKSVTIGQPSAPVTISIDSSKHNGYAISCYGGSNGTATAVGAGGNGGYKDYSWSTGATSAGVTGLAKGAYTVSLTDQKGCSASKTFKMSAPPQVTAATTVPKPYAGYAVSCLTKTNGSASVTGGGGVGGYTFSWSNGVAGATISALGVGTYTVTATDANSCASADAQAVLIAPPPIDFAIDLVSGLTCSGDSTAIFEAKPVLTTIIGDPHYSWAGGEDEATIRDKPAGTYTVTVSDDQGCSTVKSRTLDNPPGYTVKLSAGLDYNGVPIKCYGNANGRLIATVKNPAGTVTAAQDYTWYRNGVAAGFGITLDSLDALDRATYKVEITYGTGCKAHDVYALDDPDELTVAVAATTPALYNGQPISCHDKTDANLKATINNGGTGPYSYLWKNTTNTTTLLSGVGAGNYTFTVKDVNGCTATNTITLANPAPVEASISDVSDYSGYGVSCTGLTDGTMTAAGSGGTNVFTYNWSNGGRTTAVNSLLGAGLYTVTVSDKNGCSAQASEAISEPPVLEAGIASYTDVACNGGSDGVIRLEAKGGAGNYEYSGNNGATWVGNAEFKNLSMGTYTLFVQDGNGCKASAVRTLAQPSALALTFTDKEPAFCADPRGGATAAVSGGVADYSYSWTDAQGNVVGTAMRLLNVRGGIYTVTVHDAHNCPISGYTGITSTDGAKVDYTATAALCHDSADGSATLTITEGDGPFIIEWPDGQSAPEGKNLKGGDYTVLITDGHDCAVAEQVTVPAPEALALEVASFTAPTCNGDCDGSLTLLAHGGVGAYQYTWNGQNGVTQTGLCKGTYNVVLTDANNCRLGQPVTLVEPDVLTLKLATSTLATCMDGCDGKITVAGAGGNGDYAYSWDGGITGSGRDNLCPGDYSVIITDAKGCVGSAVVTLVNTPPVPVNLGGGVTLCVGQTYTLDAGAGWKTIQWSGNGLNSNAQAVTVKDPGAYQLEVTDSKGCVGHDTFLLETSYDLLKASFMIPAEAAAGDTVAIVDISWPLPETVEWDLPLEMKRISGSEDLVFGQFNTAGTYRLGLTAHLSECVDYVEKSIVIIEGAESDTGGRLGYEAYVKTFSLYANPNDGSFDVVVDLADTNDIVLSVWSSQTGSLVSKVYEKDSTSYHGHIDLRPISAGTYILRLDHARGSSYIRFIVR